MIAREIERVIVSAEVIEDDYARPGLILI